MRIVFLFCALLFGLITAAQAKKAKALLIILDGIPADVIEKLKPPNLSLIAKVGGYARAAAGGEKGGYSQTPTISAVGYNSVLTGTWVNKHNVWGNDIKAPNYHYKNIFRLFKEQSPEKKIGIFSSWLDNRTKLVGEGLGDAGNITFDFRFDGLELDTINYPHDSEKAYMHRIDEKVADAAAFAIKTNAPDLSWVYLEYTDDMGHRFGDSRQFYEAIGAADKQVGRIWEAVQQREKLFDENWLVVITTDHGRDAATGKGHGGQSDRERAGWIVTNAKDVNAYFRNNKATLVDVMPTIARFMGLAMPKKAAWEVDGVPLAGPLSITNPVVKYKNGAASISWEACENKGTVKIWAAATNLYKAGGTDEYRLLKEVPIGAKRATVELPASSPFFKIVLAGEHNTVNRWLLVGEEK